MPLLNSARPPSRPLPQLSLGFDAEDAEPAVDLASFSDFEEAFSSHFVPSSAAHADRSPAIHLGWIETPIGPMIAGAQEGALVFLEFTTRQRMESQVERLVRRFKTSLVQENDAVVRQTRKELAEYFKGRRRDFTIPLRYQGTPFEERVWSALLKIPFGETCSYEELATITSNSGAVRAVGSANGRNRIAIVIPCHRVVNKSGALGGYGGGLWRKKALLQLEQGSIIRT